jgi:hypothetical protein
MKALSFVLPLLLLSGSASARGLVDESPRDPKSEDTRLGTFNGSFGLATALAERDMGYRVLRRRPTGIVLGVSLSFLGMFNDGGLEIGPLRIADYFGGELRAGAMRSDYYADYLWFGFQGGAGGQAILRVNQDIDLAGRVAAFVDLDMSRGKIGDEGVSLKGTYVLGRARYLFHAGESCIGTAGYLHVAGTYRPGAGLFFGAGADRIGTYGTGAYTTTFRAFVGMEI